MVKTFILYCFTSMALGLVLLANLHHLLPDELVYAGEADVPVYVELQSLERTHALEDEGALVYSKGLFHIVTLEVENLSVEYSYDFLDGTVVITDGWDGTVAIAVNAQTILDRRSGYDRESAWAIPPGGTLTRTLVFDVPTDLTTPHLALESNPYVAGTVEPGRVILVEKLEDF